MLGRYDVATPPSRNVQPDVEPRSRDSPPGQGERSALAVAAKLLAIYPIIVFAFLSIATFYTYGLHQSSMQFYCRPDNSFRNENLCQEWVSNMGRVLALTVVFASAAIGLAVLLLVEFLPRKAGLGWEVYAPLMAIIATAAFILSSYAAIKSTEFGAASIGNSGFSVFWTFLPTSLFVFGLGCIKLSALKGRLRKIAILFTLLNGLVGSWLIVYLTLTSKIASGGLIG